MKEIIYKYLKWGFSIIPIAENSKAPLVVWSEYQKRLPTETEVKSWWSKHPLANIAVITGKVSNLVVVDFDSDEAVQWARENNLLETLCVETARGLHAYYRYPEKINIQNTIHLNGMKIDIRGDGGYVIAPPSIHPSGKQYRFINENMKIADFPEYFLFYLKKNDTEKRKLPVRKNETDKIEIKHAYNGVENGIRNTTLAKLTGSWIRHGLSLDEALSVAYAINEKNNPPLSEREVRRTVESIYKIHERKSKTIARSFSHEKNLLYLPLFIRNKKADTKTITYIEKTKKYEKVWRVGCDSELGALGIFDELVFTALLQIVSEQGRPVQNPVKVGSISNIAKRIVSEKSGFIYDKIEKSLMKIKHINVTTSYTFFDNTKKSYIRDSFSLIDRIVLAGQELPDGKIADAVYIWFNNVILNNINTNFVKQFDFSIFTRLSYISRGLYKIICSRRYKSRNEKCIIRISYSKLCQLLQVKQETSKSKVMQQFKKTFNELMIHKIISKFAIISKNINKNDFYIIFHS